MALATMVCVAELMTHGSSSCGQTRGEVYQEKEPTEDVAAHQDLRGVDKFACQLGTR